MSSSKRPASRRLKAAIDAVGHTAESFAEETGQPLSLILALTTDGASLKQAAHCLDRIVAVLKCSRGWLLDGEPCGAAVDLLDVLETFDAMGRDSRTGDVVLSASQFNRLRTLVSMLDAERSRPSSRLAKC